MEKMISLTLAISSMLINAYSQNDSSSIQSMLQGIDTSENPGIFFLDKLNYLSTYKLDEREEGSELSEYTRKYAFWQDRVPSGQSPLQTYANSVISAAYTESICTPTSGTFNGNWNCVGPIKASKPTDPTWLNNEQSQGRIYNIFANSTNPNTIFAGCPTGGLWKTINGGRSWINLTDGILANGAIGVNALAVNPNNPQEMYIGTQLPWTTRLEIANLYGQGIWKTTDGGSTWAIESGGAMTSTFLTNKNQIKYCPFQVGGMNMVIAISGNQIWQKIGSNSWTNVTPAGFPAEVGQDLDFANDAAGQGKFYVCSDWDPGQGKVIELTFDITTGQVSSTFTILRSGQVEDFGLLGKIYTPTGCSTLSSTLQPITNKVISYFLCYKGNNIVYLLSRSGNVQSPNACVTNNSLSYAGGQYNNVSEFNTLTSAQTIISKGFFTTFGIDNNLGEIEAHTNSPDMIYCGFTQPLRIFKSASGAWITELLDNYNTGVTSGYRIHPDVRGLHIGTSSNTPAVPGSADVVYWGTDGGISKSTYDAGYSLITSALHDPIPTNWSSPFSASGMSSNSHVKFESINGDGLILWHGFDLDVSKVGGKKITVSFDNGVASTTSTNIWHRILVGDGWHSRYDKRDNFLTPRAMIQYASNLWKNFTHGSAGTASGSNFTPPYPPNAIDSDRVWKYPTDFDYSNNILYMANKNMFSAAAGGYSWTHHTNTGDFATIGGAISLATLQCRSIKTTSNQEIQYFCSRNTGASLKVFYCRDDIGSGYKWYNRTSNISAIAAGGRITGITIDSKNENRVFICFGGVNATNRVWVSSNKGLAGTWSDMSNGLTDLPVIELVYQEGSDDIIYAATDAGVYRWDKPLACWIKFNKRDGVAATGNIPNMLATELEIDYCSGKLVASFFGRGIWESDLYMPNNLSGVSVTINASATWTGDKSIDGSILVRSPHTLTISGTSVAGSNISSTNIYMPKYGKIYVEKGAKLIISGAKITNGCKTRWGGIEVFGNSSLDQQPLTSGAYNQGYVELSSNAIIENAIVGISNSGGPVWNTPSANNSGGIIKATNAYFYNNQRSLKFISYQQVVNGDYYPDASKFISCLFETNDQYPYLPSLNFIEHVSLASVRGIEFKGCTFKNIQTTNFTAPIPFDHGKAINSIDASYTLNEGTTTSNVEGFSLGINSSAYSWGVVHPISIQNTTFDANEKGLQLSTMRYPTITTNTFKIGQLQNPSGTGYSRGTFLQNVSNFVYCSNTHTKAYNVTTLPNLYTVGLEIANAGTNDQQVEKNKFNYLRYGIDCDYVNGISTSTPPAGINFRWNKNIGNTLYDFIFQANPYIRKIQFGNAGSGSSTGNTFSQITGTTHWRQAGGGNGPVDYFYDPSGAFETPTVISNVNPIAAPSSIENSNCKVLGGLANATDLNNLESDYGSHELAYLNLKNIYDNLIDGGNTNEIIEDIENGTTAQALALRAEMLAMSPYLTEEVLRSLAMENILPQSFLFEIFMANPEATQDDGFMNYIQYEIANPLPSYMIAMIQASWSGQTARTLLEKNMVDAHENMTLLRSQLISAMLTNPTLYDEANVFSWLCKVTSLRNSYEVIEHLLYKNEFSNAISLLNNLPDTYSMTDFEVIEYDHYKTLFEFKKSLLLNNANISNLTSSQVETLKGIGDLLQPTFPRAMARSALCFYYNICYPDDIRLDPIFTSNRLKGASMVDNFKQQEVFVYPNPAKDFVVFKHDLLNANEAEQLIIQDILGSTVYTHSLSGTKGEHVWKILRKQSGSFMYKIITKSGQKFSGKLTIE